MRYYSQALASRLRQVRGERTQEEFARLHGTSQGYISDLEHGKAQPSFSFLLSLIENEGISLDWLVLGMGSPMYRISGQEREATAVREKAPELYRKVDALLLINPNLSPTLSEFLDLFFKLEKK